MGTQIRIVTSHRGDCARGNADFDLLVRRLRHPPSPPPNQPQQQQQQFEADDDADDEEEVSIDTLTRGR